MNSWKVILATMVIFGTGVITGGLLVKNMVNAPARRSMAAKSVTNLPPVNVSPQQFLRLEFLRSVRKDLDLTPEQHERIEHIIHEGQEKTRKLWDSVAPDMRKELQSVHEQIRAELSPDQRRKFELMLKSASKPNSPDNNPQLRDRLKQGNPGDPQNGLGGQPRPRRENVPPPENLAPTNRQSAVSGSEADKN